MIQKVQSRNRINSLTVISGYNIKETGKKGNKVSSQYHSQYGSQ